MKMGKPRRNRGFTLIELMVSLTLFSFVAVAATSAMITVVDGNKKARAKVDAMDGLSFVLESMTRELRVGRNYDCITPITSGQTGDCVSGTEIGFTSSEGDFIEYRFSAGQIERRVGFDVDLTAQWIGMVGGSVTIDNFTFDVAGSAPAPGDLEQPKVVIRVTGTTGVNPDLSTTFSLQTMVAQRFPDF